MFGFITYLYNTFHSTNQTDAIFSNLAKAFDTVALNRLLFKLYQLKVHSSIIKLIKAFLTHRKQAVFIEDALSNELPVIQACLKEQYWALSFFMCMNYLSSTMTSALHLFAHDYFIYHAIINSDDQLQLQHALNMFSEWCDKWEIKLKLQKQISYV